MKVKLFFLLIVVFFNSPLYTQINCIENNNLSIDSIASDVYQAEKTITAQSPAKDGASIIFFANESINLLPGFAISNGASFSAMIKTAPCENELIIADTVIVIDTASNEKLVSITPNAIIFGEDAPQASQLVENCIIISEPTDIAPQGYLRKITNMQNTNGQIILATEPATLADAIQETSFSFEVPLEDPDAAARFSRRGFTFYPPVAPIADGVKLTGSLDFDPDIVFKILKFDGIRNPIDFKIGTKGTLELNLGIELSSDKVNFSKETELYSKKLRPIFRWIPVPPPVFCFPVVITPELEVKLITELNGPTTEFNYKGVGTYQAVVRRIGNEWINDSEKDFNFTSDVFLFSSSSELFTGSVTLRIELDFQLYDIDAAEAYVFVQGKEEVSVAAEFGCTIQPSLGIGAGVEADFLETMGFEEDKLELSYDYNFNTINCFDFGAGSIANTGTEGFLNKSEVETVNKQENKSSYYSSNRSINTRSLSSDKERFESKNLAIEVIPNPVYYTTKIKVFLSQKDYVDIALYDMSGKQIENIFTGEQESGIQEYTLNIDKLSKGMYYVVAQTGQQFMKEKVVVMK